MKTIWITFVFACVALVTTAQQPFKNLRYDEDYSFLKDSLKRSWYDDLKFHPLNKDRSSWLSTGGEVRHQFFHYTNEEWGNAPADNDGFILARLLVHTDLHINKSLRVFTQVQTSLADGRISAPSPVEQNELDLINCS
ncbi:MAG: alginate export family protein [Bacteroidota bacterium]